MGHELKEGEKQLLAVLPINEPLSSRSLKKLVWDRFQREDRRIPFLAAGLAARGLATAMTLNHNEEGVVGYRITTIGIFTRSELDLGPRLAP